MDLILALIGLGLGFFIRSRCSRCSPQVKKSSPAEEQAKTSSVKEDPNKAPHGWSGDKFSKHPSDTISTKDRSIVEGSAVCEAGDITRAPHSWSGDKNSKHPSKTISTKDRSIVEGSAVCEAGDITRAPHGWSGDENSKHPSNMTSTARATELVSYEHRKPAIKHFRQVHPPYYGSTFDHIGYDKSSTEGTMVIQPEPPPRDRIRTLHTAPNWAESIKKVSASDYNQAKIGTAIEWKQRILEENQTKSKHHGSNQARFERKMASAKSNQTKMFKISPSLQYDKMSQFAKSNLIIQFNKLSNLTDPGPTVEIGLRTPQHTAPNWAESIEKVSASDGNQANMFKILPYLQTDKVNMQNHLEKFEENVIYLIHDGAAKNLIKPTPDYGAADLAKNGVRLHNAAARNMITPKFYDAAARNISTPACYNASANSLRKFNSRVHNGAAGNSSLQQETLSPEKGGKKGNIIRPLPSSRLSSTNTNVDRTVAVHPAPVLNSKVKKVSPQNNQHSSRVTSTKTVNFSSIPTGQSSSGNKSSHQGDDPPTHQQQPGGNQSSHQGDDPPTHQQQPGGNQSSHQGDDPPTHHQQPGGNQPSHQGDDPPTRLPTNTSKEKSMEFKLKKYLIKKNCLYQGVKGNLPNRHEEKRRFKRNWSKEIISLDRMQALSKNSPLRENLESPITDHQSPITTDDDSGP